MKVKDILATKKRRGQILRVQVVDQVAQAVQIMVEHDTGSVAVYEDDSFIGMLTFREVLIAIHKEGFASAEKIACGDVVERGGHCTTPEDSVDQIRNIMTSQHVRYLPVVQDGHLTDVISFYDVARSVAKAVDFENRMLKEYISDWPTDRE
ncbi:MAG: CBS domain-containing protein [Proteobacteria bacterium]|nr:CBS domain-containing protein [Pseudomonadota bacterium]